ncbi:CPBP family intramembrane glutamic endopeptidase [Bacillus pinisoli]|uniref:CPBP family intramembrane glutamic endopeptidase n=1 Tax=Bacillus pinisoli TaxID=2901866 RepID=UPI001FF64DCB|nr:CPBP family intramembrane glutamic endopeptidase [Bacillus pinisoli]
MKSELTCFIVKYLLLTLYFNLLPILINMNDIIRFLHILAFFPLAFLIAKLSGAGGMKSYGVVFVSGWKRNVGYGFTIGSITWTVLFLFYILFNKLHFQGVKFEGTSLVTLLIIIFGFGTGSLINDMITRGLVFYHFKDKISVISLFFISIILYSVDDIWYAGLSLQNCIFSVILGLSLTYALYKTNSIWFTTGIHFGLNLIYGSFYGVSGSLGTGIFNVRETTPYVGWLGWLSSVIAMVMFLIVMYVFNKNNKIVITDLSKFSSFGSR